MTQTTITYRNKTITLDSAAVKGCTSYQYDDGVYYFDIVDFDNNVLFESGLYFDKAVMDWTIDGILLILKNKA